MQLEFVENYEKLMQDSILNLQKTLMIKINSLQVCQNQNDNKKYALNCFDYLDIQKKTLNKLKKELYGTLSPNDSCDSWTSEFESEDFISSSDSNE